MQQWCYRNSFALGSLVSSSSKILTNFLMLIHQNRKGLIGNDHCKHQQLLCIDATDTETAGYTFLRSFP